MKTVEKSRPLCRRLRSKGMFVQVEPEPWLPSERSGIHWCSRTQNAIGPDGNPVVQDECCEGRECFEKA